MSGNPLKALSALGQSIWLDYIDREILVDGTLDRLIQEDSVSGLTSNPAIFQKAIARGGAYRDDTERLRAAGADRETLYERLVLADIGQAADAFRALYEATEGRDGYVSIEVSPPLARDTEATIAEARELWQRLDRPNIDHGDPAVRIDAAIEAAPAVLHGLVELGINLHEIDDQLEEEGIRKFVDPYQSLLETLAGMAD